MVRWGRGRSRHPSPGHLQDPAIGIARERGGTGIADAAAARKLLTPVYYGLRDGETLPSPHLPAWRGGAETTRTSRMPFRVLIPCNGLLPGAPDLTLTEPSPERPNGSHAAQTRRRWRRTAAESASPKPDAHAEPSTLTIDCAAGPFGPWVVSTRRSTCSLNAPSSVASRVRF